MLASIESAVRSTITDHAQPVEMTKKEPEQKTEVKKKK